MSGQAAMPMAFTRIAFGETLAELGHQNKLPTIKPLDETAVVEAARRTGCVITSEDHSIIGGLGSAVAETLAEQYPTRMRRIGIRDVFSESAPNEPLLRKYGLTAHHIVMAAQEVMAQKQ